MILSIVVTTAFSSFFHKNLHYWAKKEFLAAFTRACARGNKFAGFSAKRAGFQTDFKGSFSYASDIPLA
jgi:hypothetical protein